MSLFYVKCNVEIKHKKIDPKIKFLRGDDEKKRGRNSLHAYNFFYLIFFKQPTGLFE